MENKICVYAICKNEINNVAQWVDNMSEADYIVVLDTGSTDGTYEFLQNDPRITKVKKKSYKNFRFDTARNESMKLVPKDANILLCTDLDERFTTPGWGDLIRSSWTSNIWRGHYLYVWSHTSSGSPGDTFTYDKLHTKDYKWTFPVHEVLMNKTIEGYEFINEEKIGHLIDYKDQIILEHYPDLSKSRNYIDLLLKRLEENHEDSYSYFLLGREYGILDDYDNCIKYFNQALNSEDIKDRRLTRHTILGYLGDIYLMKNEVSIAIYYYSLQLLEDPTYREPYFNLAEIYNRMHMHEVAIDLVKMGIERTYRHFDWSERSSHWNEKPYDLLSIAYYYLKMPDEGIENAVRALQLDPMNERIQKNYLALLDLKKGIINNE